MNIDYKYRGLIFGIVILSYILSFIARKMLTRVIRKKSDELQEDPTKFVFLKNSASLIIFSVAFIVIFLITPGLNDIGKGLFAGAGIIAATIGFASQKVFANILNGLIKRELKSQSLICSLFFKTEILQNQKIKLL